MALAGIEGAMCSGAGDLLIVLDLFERLGEPLSPVRLKLVALAG